MEKERDKHREAVDIATAILATLVVFAAITLILLFR